MPSTLTVTGKVGPGVTLTTAVFNNVKSFAINTANEVLDVEFSDGSGAQRMQIDISAATTITCTVSGNNYTLTIS